MKLKVAELGDGMVAVWVPSGPIDMAEMAAAPASGVLKEAARQGGLHLWVYPDHIEVRGVAWSPSGRPTARHLTDADLETLRIRFASARLVGRRVPRLVLSEQDRLLLEVAGDVV